MLKPMRILVILCVLFTSIMGAAHFINGVEAQATSASFLVPCIIDGPEVYLVIDNTRRHIVDWDTFLNLGYQQPDIMPCGVSAAYPEGSPITRLFKGTDAPVYWMENGVRRHIPDMATFSAMGFQISEITLLPDNILSLWPLGDPMPKLSEPSAQIVQELVIGDYTIRHWTSPQEFFDYAIISAPHQPDIRVEQVQAIGQLPASDVTGEGHPDVMFILDKIGSRCCAGTSLYDLGAAPTEVLQIFHPYGTYSAEGGAGIFRDLDGDGRYEFITDDGVYASCSTPVAEAVLAYDPNQQRYVSASRQFLVYYADYFVQLAESANAVPETRMHYGCVAQSLVQTLLYLGLDQEARVAFDRLYAAPDAEEYWNDFVEGVKRGRFYEAP